MTNKWGREQYQCFHTACRSLGANKEDKEEALGLMQSEGFFPTLKDPTLSKKCWWIVKNIIAWRKSHEKGAEILASEEGKAILAHMNRTPEEVREEEQQRLLDEVTANVGDLEW